MRPFLSLLLLIEVDSFQSTHQPRRSDVRCAASGLYRPIAETVWKQLTHTGWLTPVAVDDELATNTATAKGIAEHQVDMTVRAMQASSESSPLSYARMALLETVPTLSIDNSLSTTGIQVLNLVLFPPSSSLLPVWGADFVSLPGSKHLLLLDAQPMTLEASDHESWQQWYTEHEIANAFPWGGDLPEPVQRYVSPTALWTRFTIADTDALDRIQGPLVRAVEEHLQIYLQLVGHAKVDRRANVNHQADYIQYRLTNDPARPMLKALYGEEWTETVLSKVLFPQS